MKRKKERKRVSGKKRRGGDEWKWRSVCVDTIIRVVMSRIYAAAPFCSRGICGVADDHVDIVYSQALHLYKQFSHSSRCLLFLLHVAGVNNNCGMFNVMKSHGLPINHCMGFQYTSNESHRLALQHKASTSRSSMLPSPDMGPSERTWDQLATLRSNSTH